MVGPFSKTIASESCTRLIVNYSKRLAAVITNKGYATKY
jgi:hypothetical protein